MASAAFWAVAVACSGETPLNTADWNISSQGPWALAITSL